MPNRPIWRKAAILACLLACVFQGGCAGAHTTIRADRANYPVSFSGAVPDSSGRVLAVGQELKKVGVLSESYWRWSVLYDSIHSHVDVSEEINEAVREAKGEAIANFSVTSTECVFDWMVPLTLLPFWPGCAIVEVTGDVVVRDRRATPQQRADVGSTGKKPRITDRDVDDSNR